MDFFEQFTCWLQCFYCGTRFRGVCYLVCHDCRKELERRKSNDELNDSEFNMTINMDN